MIFSIVILHLPMVHFKIVVCFDSSMSWRSFMITWCQFHWPSEDEISSSNEDQALKIFWKLWNQKEMESFEVTTRLVPNNTEYV